MKYWFSAKIDVFAAAIASRCSCRTSVIAGAPSNAGSVRTIATSTSPSAISAHAGQAAGSGGFGRPHVPSGRTVPALARQLSQRTRGFVVDQRADIVEWRVAAAVGVVPRRIGGQMARRVPAVEREVEAADERQRIVDDDELLMVRGAGRMMICRARNAGGFASASRT